MKKKFLLLLALGLAASVQAQNAPATAPANAAVVPVAEPAPATPAAQPAPAPAPANAASAAAVPVAEPAPAAPAAQPAAAPANAAEPIAVAEPAPAADSAAAPEQAATPADSAAAPEQVAVADSAKAATDSLANDTSKVAKAPVNKLGDILHGNAYNTVWNEAAAATIGGNIGYPHFMYGSKLAYFDPVAQQGAVAFGDSWTYFLSFDNNANMGLLTAGIAFQKFGASLDYSMGKHWRYTDHADKSEETEKSTDAGSMVGANVSANFGSFDVLLSGHYMTPYGDYFLSLPDSETEEDAWAASGYVGLSYSGDVYYWTLGVEGMRNEYKHNEALIIMTPNILGEVQLSKYFMAFGGASYDWVAAAYSDRELNKEKTETIATTVGATTVNLGARFEYGPTAVELAFTERFLENPFSGYADKSAIVTSLGAFIFF